jgi:Prp8 binding protein
MEIISGGSEALIKQDHAQSQALQVATSVPSSGDLRTSSLKSPTMLLTGHKGAVYSLDFDPTGNFLASASFDRHVFLWSVYGDCTNYNVLHGHKSGVTQVKWCFDQTSILTSSADNTCACWDVNSGKVQRRYTSHSGIVNSLATASDVPDFFCSGSDDCSVIFWDRRTSDKVEDLFCPYQVTAVTMSKDSNHIYAGGIDNVIRRWDMRNLSVKKEPDLVLEGCADTVTGISLSPDGSYLLSNSMDKQLRKWNVRPFCQDNERLEMCYTGVHHGAEKNLLKCSWAADGERVASGSADRNVHVWDVSSGQEEYLLGGHQASVNDVIFHPKEPVIASAGSDSKIYLGELS